MSKKHLSKHLLLLKVIQNHCKGKIDCEKNFCEILNYLNDKSIKFLCQCIRNCIAPKNFKNFGPRKETLLFQKIKPHKKTILKLIDKKSSIKFKRRQLQKGAGFFLPLLTTVIPLIGSLIGNLIKKKDQNKDD